MFIECKTADGRLVSLSCPEDAVEEVQAALAKAKSIDIPTTHQVNVSHGGYGRYSRFNIEQHKYAGGGHPGSGGFIEALEIKETPDGRCGLVLHQHVSGYYRYGSTFWEFDSLENMLAVWGRAWGTFGDQDGVIANAKGFIRRVECGGLTPWFYAIGDQALFGDYAYPNHVGDDPVYRPQQRFVVYNADGFPTIKTCMGCYRVTRDVPKYSGGCWGSTEEKEFRVVYWDDGTIYDEQHNAGCQSPRPLCEKDLFAQEAVDQFRKCLSGQEKTFTIYLSDGNRFTCRFQPIDKGSHTIGGEYFARCTMEDGEEKCGTFEFEPTPECPTVELFLERRSVQEIHELKFSRKGLAKKKWAGVIPAQHNAGEPVPV